MKRRLALKLLAGSLALGGWMFQLGGCWTMASNTGVASFDISLLMDSQGRLFGVFALCGTPNTLVLNENEAVGEVLNTEDDLVHGCPISNVVVTGTGGGGTGGTGT